MSRVLGGWSYFGSRARCARGCRKDSLCLVLTLCAALPSCFSDREPMRAPVVPDTVGVFPTSGGPVLLDDATWSTTGRLAYRDNGVICILPGGLWRTDPAKAGVRIEAGSGQTLFLQGAYSPRWSASGDELTFEMEGDIFVYSLADSSTRRVVSRGRTFQPALSPDGSFIAFDADWGDRGYEIWVANSRDGSGAHPLGSRGPGDQRRASWTESGDSILCERLVDDGSMTRQVYFVPVGGGVGRQATFDTREKRSPSISPDGQTVLYSAVEPGGKAIHVWVVSRTGESARMAIPEPSWNPSWSPDGSSVTFTGFWEKSMVDSCAGIFDYNLQSAYSRCIASRFVPTCP